MNIVDFDNVKITTMTVVIPIEGTVIIENSFPLLPVKKLQLKDGNKGNKKPFKIPWPGSIYAGSIFSCRYAGITRGLIKSNKKKAFRNSIGVDICTSGKNIAAKLCKDKIQMCGVNSQELAIETAEHLVNHLKHIQEELDYCNSIPEIRNSTIDWLIRETEGKTFIVNEQTQEIISLEDGEKISDFIVYDSNGNPKYNYKEVPFKWEEGDSITAEGVFINKYGEPYFRSFTKKEKRDGLKTYPYMKIDSICNLDESRLPVDEKGVLFSKIVKIPLAVMKVTSVKYPDCMISGEEYPKEVDSRICKFLSDYIQDFAYHHLLKEFLLHFKNNGIERVYIEKEVNGQKIPLKAGRMNVAMMNYSYSLNMNVDRWSLTQLIDGYGDYRAVFDNTTDHHVTITLPYEKDEMEIIKRKGTNISFMVYKSGIVTQSGPLSELMREAYYDFMNFINENRDAISLKDGKAFNIKFKPIYYNTPS